MDIKKNILVTVDRCFILYQFAKLSTQKDGEIAEVGVYKGGTARMIAKSCPEKTFHLFDTFSGMPESQRDVDFHQQGEFADTSLESVKRFLKDCQNVEFHPGLFPQTINGVKNKTFCYVHVDVDIYPSVKSCLEFFYPRLVPGGIMLFDDYQWKDTPGVKKALDEFSLINPRNLLLKHSISAC